MSNIDSDHFIGRLLLEFQIEEESDANQLHQDLSRLFNAEIQKILQSVLDELNEPMMRIRLDRIEIDLGEIEEGAFDQVVIARLRERFRSKMLSILGYPGGIKLSSSEMEVSSLVPGRMEVVEEFLKTGRVPTRASHMDMRVEDILQELLREHTADSIDLIRRIVQSSEHAGRRIAMQLRPSTIELIYRTLQPNFRNFILDQELKVATAIAKAAKSTLDRTRQEVRFVILQYLLGRTGPFVPALLRKELAEKLTRTYGDVVAPVFGDIDKASAAVGADGLPNEGQAFQLLERFFQQGMPANLIPDFVEAWDLMIQKSPQSLLKLIGSTGQGVRTLLKLGEVLPALSLELLLHRAIPAKSNLILEVYAAVAALVVAYSRADVSTTSTSKTIMAVLLQMAAARVEQPATITAAAAVQALSSHFAKRKEMPAAVKEALKDQDIPGVSGLKPLDRGKSAAQNAAQAKAQATPADKAATSDTRPEFELEVVRPKWVDGESPEVQQERETLAEIDAAVQSERREFAEAEQQAALEEAERLAAQSTAELGEEGLTASEPTPEQLANLTPVQREAYESRQKRREEIKAQIRAQNERATAAAEAKAAIERDTSSDTPYRREEAESPLGSVVARINFVEHYLQTGKIPWWVEEHPSGGIELIVGSLLKAAPKRLEESLRELIYKTSASALVKVTDRLVSSLSEPFLFEVINLLLPGIAGIMPVMAELLRQYHAAPPRSLSLPGYLRTSHQFAWHFLVRFAFDYLSSDPGSSAMVRYVVDGVGRSLGDSPRIFLKEFTAITDTLIGRGDTRFVPIKTMLPWGGMGLDVAPPTPHPQQEGTPSEADPAFTEYMARIGSLVSADEESDTGTIQERFERRERQQEEMLQAARKKAEEAAQPPRMVYVEGTVIEERLSLDAAIKALERAEKRLREAEKALVEAIQRGDPAPAQARLIAAVEEQRVAAEQVEQVRAAIADAKARRAQAGTADAPPRTSTTDLPAQEPRVDSGTPQDQPAADTPATSAEQPRAEEGGTPETRQGGTPETRQGGTPEQPATEQGKDQALPKADKPAQPYTYDPDDYVTEIDATGAPLPREESSTPTSGQDARDPDAPDQAGYISPEEEEVLRQVAAQRLNLPDGAAKALVMYYKTADALVALFRHYFQHGSLPGNLPIALPRGQFVLLFDYVMEKHPTEFFAMVRTAAASRSSRKRLLDIGESALRAAIHALSPRIATMLLTYMESVQKLADSLSAPIKKENLLEHALAYSARVQSGMFSPLDYMRNLTLYAESELRVEPRRLISWFKSKVEESQSGQNLAIKQVLNVLQNTMLPTEKKKESKERILRPLNEELYVTNAGLTLLNPFFPQLFHMTKLLLPDRSNFVDSEARNRAIHLMQYAVTKEMDAPEEKLTLNKLFVGMPLDEPVVASIEMTQEEIDIIESMLTAACKRWAAIKTENPEFLRAQFLDREGKIKRRGEGWDIFVSQKPYDVLLAKLPWSMNPVKLPWIDYKIEIFWR